MQYGQNVDFVAVIGDVVGSRRHPDRARLHRDLSNALAVLAPTHPWVRPPRITVGDEFQFATAALDTALAAVWDLRMALLPRIDVRYGIGLGEAALLDDATEVEDGTAWWAARGAIEQAKADGKGSDRRVRMRVHESVDAPALTAAVRAADAAQAAVDDVVAGLDEIDHILLRALRAGASQAEAGREVGLTQPTVSHRVRTRGIGRLLALRDDLRH